MGKHELHEGNYDADTFLDELGPVHLSDESPASGTVPAQVLDGADPDTNPDGRAWFDDGGVLGGVGEVTPTADGEAAEVEAPAEVSESDGAVETPAGEVPEDVPTEEATTDEEMPAPAKTSWWRRIFSR